MNCLDFRRLIGADPHSDDSAAAAHARTCSACADFAERTRALDEKILRALQIRVPAAPTTPKFLSDGGGYPDSARAPAGRQRWLAIAASVIVGIGIAVSTWLLFPRTALADELVAHMAHEPQAWTAPAGSVTPAQLEDVLKRPGATTNIAGAQVRYAQSCWFRGHFVPHLIVQDERGPLTVMVLQKEGVKQEQTFDAGGYSGVIFPAAQGSVAVLARAGHGDDHDRVDIDRARRAALRIAEAMQ